MNNLREYIRLVEEDPRIGRWGDTPEITAKRMAARRQSPTAPVYDSPIPLSFASKGTAPVTPTPTQSVPIVPLGSQGGSRKTLEPAPAKPRPAPASAPAKPRPAPASAPAVTGNKYGYNSPEEVQQIQSQLTSMGYDVAVNGKWDPKTDSAYKSAYQQMYGSAPGSSQSNDPNAAGGFVTGTATTGPKGSASFSNTTNTSAAPTQQTATTGSNFDANGNIIGMPGKVTSAAAPQGRDTKGKPYTDWYGNNPQPGAKSLEESEVSRIRDLINYKN